MKFPTPHMSLKGYMDRWYIIPRNRWCNIYLHKITGDDDRYHHDHPWPSISICLRGEMIEYILDKQTGIETTRSIYPGRVVSRLAAHLHRLQVSVSPVWTLFITGRESRKWGFWTPIGWMDHERFARSRRYCGQCGWMGLWFEGRPEGRYIGPNFAGGWGCPKCFSRRPTLQKICSEYGCDFPAADAFFETGKCAIHGEQVT